MAKYVICFYCKQRFDRDKEPFVQVSSRRYAHKACCSRADEEKEIELKEKLDFENYVKKILNIPTLDARIQKQIKKYTEEYKYTYSGMHKALIYFYEIKGNSIEKANGGIGIIPYVYKQAYDYHLALWQAQQRNEDKNVENYIPRVEIVIIPRPQVRRKKKTMFNFLDNEEVEN